MYEQADDHQCQDDGDLLLKLGFKAVRQKRSHVFYRHPDGRTTTIPRHKSKDLARPLIRKILSDVKTVEQYQEEPDKL